MSLLMMLPRPEDLLIGMMVQFGIVHTTQHVQVPEVERVELEFG